MDISQVEADRPQSALTPDGSAGKDHDFIVSVDLPSHSPYVWIRFIQEPGADGYFWLSAENAGALGRVLCGLAAALD
jgi:hypothetical protein